MKTLLFYFKTNTIVALLVIALLGFTSNLYAQTPAGYCTVLHQPCNGDGILEVTITEGMTPPLTVYYADTIHTNINSLTDICEGLDFCYSIFILDYYQNELTLSTGFEPPLTIDHLDYVEIPCTQNTVSVTVTINGGETASDAEFYRQGNLYVGSGNPFELSEGQYTFFAYDENSCRRESDSLVIIRENPFTVNFETTPASCDNGTAEIVSVEDGISPYSFLWSTGETGSLISDLTLGLYVVTISDAQGCTMLSGTYIEQLPVIDVQFTSNRPHCLLNDGSITAYAFGGAEPYSYLFDSGETTQTISNLSAGYYSVFVTDANGCFASGNAFLYSNSPITVTDEVVNPDCNNTNGSVSLFIEGGNPPYDVTWNTIPAQTGMTISGLAAGNYEFTVTDSEGCKKNGYVNLYSGELFAYIVSENSICPENNGWVGVYASSNSLPIEYQWSNFETGNIIDSIGAGTYSCTISDAAGCTLVKSKTVAEVSPIELNFLSTLASCPYTPDGSIFVAATSGTPPYVYHWSNEQESPIATNLLPGIYFIQVVDANGCSKNKYIQLGYSSESDNCYCTISGTAFEDLNDNCVFDIGENPIQNIRINCPPFGSVFTNASGEYSFLLPTGDYTLSETILGYYPLETCQPQSYNINVTAESGCVMTYNFAHSVNPIHDIHTQITTVQHAVLGYDYIQKVMIKNAGTIAESNIQFGYAHDGQLLYESSSEPLLSQGNAFLYPDWYGITESFPVLEPGESKYIYLYYQVPTNIPLGTEVFFIDTASYESPITNWQNDYSPWNNLTNYVTYTVGSFDPNNKEVYPKGLGAHGFIANSDSILTYTVNFENTGSYFARKIVVYDTLDTDLDWNTLQPISSTHDCVTRITDDGVVIFTFDDIYLPYEGIGRYGSVTYSLKQKQDLTPGTEISNSAAIVFDFNEPVITNTVLNTIFWPEGVEQLGNENPICVFPNPANNSFSVSGENIYNVELLNSLGQIVLQTESTSNIFIGNQPTGIYFVKIETEKSIVVMKLIKQ